MGMHIARSAIFNNNIEVGDTTFKEYYEKRVTEKELNKAIIPQLVYNSKAKIKFDKQELRNILKNENDIRLHEVTSRLYDADITKFYEIDEYCITQALRISGYNPDEDDSLKAYRFATMEYINDPEVREEVVWLKYDKARLGEFKVGQDELKTDIIIHDLEGNRLNITELLNPDLPNLVISGSAS
jgi:hypothetical protein